jgi:tetratricopeptide (TPR) repeat protein
MSSVGVAGDLFIAKNPFKAKTESIVRDPNDLVQDAYESLKKGDYDCPIEYSDKAIKVNPRFAFAHNIKGQAYFNLRRYTDALKCYEKALELRPKYIEVINNKGLVYAAIGDYNKALECFDQSGSVETRLLSDMPNKAL